MPGIEQKSCFLQDKNTEARTTIHKV